MVYIPRGADPQTTRDMLLYSSDTKLDQVRLFHGYRARFQIEFAFRDAKQHLGLNDGQARSRTKLDFRFNIVFAAFFWARLQTRFQTDGPLGLFSLHQPKQRNFETEIHKRFVVRSTPRLKRRPFLKRIAAACRYSVCVQSLTPLETESAGH